jgi:hypothetical protein
MAATLHCGEARPAPYPDFSPRQTFLRDELDRPYRVMTAGRITHAVGAGFMVNSNPFTLTAWTRCDDDEVSLDAVYTSCEPPTCPQCAAIEARERLKQGEHV